MHVRAVRKQRQGSSGSNKHKQNGSLHSRESLDSDLHYIELDASDPEDLPPRDELVDTLYPNGSDSDKDLPPLVESDDESCDGDLSLQKEGKRARQRPSRH